ncbi:hypothetical protein [Hymenobacter defluvii]|uniref:TonB-dependent receptor plug domain-containing protein n=1 Tax=Hymenobacter defluvii TaxID=2054411 RepID=A0ABS3TEZ4_9BACT|nr:hypothetical protein [Hymenobacter defluvii]MBO3272227.1 hypothetical protein [Hymenobacter defluvii]
MPTLTLRRSLLTALLVGGVTIASNAQGVPSLSTKLPYQYLQGKKADGGRTFAPSNNLAFYLLDGTPVTREHLLTIAPAQIQAISIIKDSLALASYGPRARHGAVLVTTKK